MSSLSRYWAIGGGGRDHVPVERLVTCAVGSVGVHALAADGGDKLAGLERLQADEECAAVPPSAWRGVVTQSVDVGVADKSARQPRGRVVRLSLDCVGRHPRPLLVSFERGHGVAHGGRPHVADAEEDPSLLVGVERFGHPGDAALPDSGRASRLAVGGGRAGLH